MMQKVAVVPCRNGNQTFRKEIPFFLDKNNRPLIYKLRIQTLICPVMVGPKVEGGEKVWKSLIFFCAGFIF